MSVKMARDTVEIIKTVELRALRKIGGLVSVPVKRKTHIFLCIVEVGSTLSISLSIGFTTIPIVEQASG